MFKGLFIICLIGLFIIPEPAPAQEQEDLPDIEAQVARKKRKVKDKAGDYDDKKQEIRLIATIESKEFDEINSLTCHLRIVGEIMTDQLRKAREEAYIILHEQEKTFDLEGMGEAEVETDPITVRFDESNAARMGARYEGYLITITDEKGRILHQDTDKSYLRKDLAKANALPLMKPFNDDLEVKANISHSVTVKK